MAEDPSNTKPDLCSLDEADWISATELGENIAQINHGAWIIAPGDIQEALAGGCRAKLELVRTSDGQKLYVQLRPEFWRPDKRLLVWVNALNPTMQRGDYPDRPWPWELRAYLLSSERKDFDATARIFLRRAEAAQWGLPLESPQAIASEEPPPSREQPGEPMVGPAGGETAPILAPAADASVPTANTEVPVNRGGRPTDRDMVLEEAERRLKLEEAERRLKPEEAERRLERPQQVPKTLWAFSCELHEWLKDHGEHHVAKTGGVMKADTIEGHVRLLWNAYKARR